MKLSVYHWVGIFLWNGNFLLNKEQNMSKYFVKKDGKFLNTVLEFEPNFNYHAETNAEEWVA